MPTTAAFSARNSRVNINGSESAPNATLWLYANQWTVAAKVDELDVSTFEEFGFTNYEDGLMDGDFSFDGFWDALVHSSGLASSGQLVATSPPVLYPGLSLTHTRFYIKGANQTGRNGAQAPIPANGLGAYPSYVVPSLKLFTGTVSAGVRGTLNASFSGKNQGVFYMPGQTTGSANTNPRNLWF